MFNIQKIIVPDNYLLDMRLTKDDIKKMVNECVTQIIEARGALDDKLRGLAELIVGRVKSGEDEFTLTGEEVAQYYPYKNAPTSLNVRVEEMYSQYTGNKAVYSRLTNTIAIDRTYAVFLRSGRYTEEYESILTEIVMHELTHLVNHYESGDNERIDSIPRPMKFERTEPSKIAKRILYLFDKGEMNARATEFKWELKRNGVGRGERSLAGYDSVTRLSSMRKLIDAVQNDTQPSDDQPLSVVELLLQSRGHRKMQIDGRERMLNPSPEDFEKAKKAIVKKLTRAYNEFYQKLSKIYYDQVSA